MVSEVDRQLFKACEEGDAKKALELIEKGGDINVRDGDGRTALMRASKRGHIEVVKLLLEKGADVRARDKNNRTCVMGASKKGQMSGTHRDAPFQRGGGKRRRPQLRPPRGRGHKVLRCIRRTLRQ